MSAVEEPQPANPRQGIRRLVHSRRFENICALVIVINAILIGVELTYKNTYVEIIQHAILMYFVFELILRFVGKDDLKEYLSDGWNYFDIVIVSASFVSDTYADLSDISVLRAFRVLRIIRLLRQLEELRLITSVLLRSVRSLGYSGVIFLLFMYAYAVVGVSLFRATDYAASANAQLHPTQPDPYGSLGEAMFTLFRIMTGEDWTDLRYNLIAMLPDKSVTITLFHVSWMALSAFLLINLVVGAVVNNYSSMMLEVREENARRKAAVEARSGRDDTASPAG